MIYKKPLLICGPPAPCKGCEERQVGCHASCDSYIQWKAVMADIRENIKDFDEATNARLSIHRKRRMI